MPICGWVINLSGDDRVQKRTAARLARLPGIELGTRQGSRLPLISEGDKVEDVDAFEEAALSDPDIAFINLVYSDFSDIDSVDATRLMRRKRRQPRQQGALSEEVAS